MSANLIWRPVSRSTESLPDALKFVLRDKYGLDSEWTVFGQSDRSYLTGLAHAGVEGAQELLDLIEKHGSIELKLEY